MTTTVLVFSLYFFIIIAITFFTTMKLRKASSGQFSDEFFVGGRKLGPLTLAILVAAGVVSSGTFIGTPGTSSTMGPGYTLIFTGGAIPLSLYVLGIFGKKINIVGRRTNSETFIDIFRYRFENNKLLIFTLVITIMTVLIVSVVADFIGGSRVIQSMTGIPFEVSLIAFGGLITIYTALGGLRGVAFVGVLQGLIMTIGSIVLVVVYFFHFDGLEPILEKLSNIDSKLLTPNYGGEVSNYEMMGYWFTYGIGLAALPWGVQSTLGYGSVKTMKRAIIIGIVFVTIWITFISSLGGAAGRAFLPDLATPDFTIPALTQGLLPDALAGIVLAGVAAAGQSTIAALFLLGSGSIVINTYKAFINPNASEMKIKKATMIVTAAIGVTTIILALNPPETLQVLITFANAASGSALFAPLVLGLFWTRTTKYGAFAGIISGLLTYTLFDQFDLGISVLYEAPFLFSFPLSFVFTIGVSLMTKKPSKEVVRTYFGEM